LEKMGLNEWLMVISTLLGPILAVQAQKWVERARSAGQRRDWIFTTLMATRQARLSPDHVRALNMIDFAFYGIRIPFTEWVWRRSWEREVITTWHDYHEHLSTPASKELPPNEAQIQAWVSRGDELFTNLLDRLARSNRFRFDRASLKTGSYYPDGHSAAELEQQNLRRLAVDVLAGKTNLSMDVRSWPIDEKAAQQQQRVMAELVENQRKFMETVGAILDRLTHKSNSEAVPAGPANDTNPTTPNLGS